MPVYALRAVYVTMLLVGFLELATMPFPLAWNWQFIAALSTMNFSLIGIIREIK